MQQYASSSETDATDDELTTNPPLDDDAQQQLMRKRKREEQALDEEVATLRAELQDDEDGILDTAVHTPAHQAQRLLDLQAAELLAVEHVDGGVHARAEQLLRALHTKLTAGMGHGLLEYEAAKGFCRDVGVVGKVSWVPCVWCPYVYLGVWMCTVSTRQQYHCLPPPHLHYHHHSPPQWQDAACSLDPPRPLSLLAPPRKLPSTTTNSTPEYLVDVCLPMPASMFRDKDHLNHRYHAKRAAYLAMAVRVLKKDAAQVRGEICVQ